MLTQPGRLMQVYVSLLRGINVGGHNKIKMADLKKVYTGAGMADVQSYIQSGNVVFRSPDDASTVQQTLEAAIALKFGFAVDVLIRTANDWARIAKTHPFTDVPDFEEKKVYVTVLAAPPANPTPLDPQRVGDEKYFLSDDVVYLYCTHGRAKTKLTNDLFERHYGQRATTRNWKTTRKLAEMAAALS